MKTYTRDELTAKLVGMIEPMPTCSLRDLCEDGDTVQTLTYMAGEPIKHSKVSHWLWYPCDVNAAWRIRETEGLWMPATDMIHPLDNIGDTIRCADAADYRWRLVEGMNGEGRVATIRDCKTAIFYTDNNHALALALALASAVDGERAEVA